MGASIRIWRIAVEGPHWSAADLSGRGAETTGGRWNRPGTPMLYASSSVALACLETLVHGQAGPLLPLNRYLVQIDVPASLWRTRRVFDADRHAGWDATPPGLASLEWGTSWAAGARGLLAEVPSVVVPEELNLLVNPRHADLRCLEVRVLRRWHYDPRIGNRLP